jgi:hypothetical protein
MFDLFHNNVYECLPDRRDCPNLLLAYKSSTLIDTCKSNSMAKTRLTTEATISDLIDTATIAVPYCNISCLPDSSLSPQASLTTIIRRICRDLCFAAHLATLEAAMRREVEHV